MWWWAISCQCSTYVPCCFQSRKCCQLHRDVPSTLVDDILVWLSNSISCLWTTQSDDASSLVVDSAVSACKAQDDVLASVECLVVSSWLSTRTGIRVVVVYPWSKAFYPQSSQLGPYCCTSSQSHLCSRYYSFQITGLFLLGNNARYHVLTISSIRYAYSNVYTYIINPSKTGPKEHWSRPATFWGGCKVLEEPVDCGLLLMDCIVHVPKHYEIWHERILNDRAWSDDSLTQLFPKAAETWRGYQVL